MGVKALKFAITAAGGGSRVSERVRDKPAFAYRILSD